MTIISTSDLQDLKSDIDTIDEVVESAKSTTTSKLGTEIRTLSGLAESIGYDVSLGVFAVGKTIEYINQVLSYDGGLYRPDENLPYTTDGATPDADSGTWLVVSDGVLSGIARSRNVQDSEVIYSADTTTVLDDVLYIYDSPTQITWGKPATVGAGETIQSVVGDQLTTDVTTYTMDPPVDLSDIATNTSDIATNTSDIATNTSDIATNTSDIATNTSGIAALESKYITSNVTVTVGSGGDYATINEALTYLSGLVPTHQTTNVTGTIILLTGFVMAEQVIVEGIDLGWITITGVDAETTITRSSLLTSVPTSLGSRYPAFGATNNATLPIIDQLFTMDTSGSSDNRDGVLCAFNSKCGIKSGAGIKNTGGLGMFADSISQITAEDSNFDNPGTYCVEANNGSTINCQGATLTNCSRAVNANRGSHVTAYYADFTGVSVYGVRSFEGSKVDAAFTNSSSSTGGYDVSRGGIIAAYGATGTLSQTANTVTSDGIIFQ